MLCDNKTKSVISRWLLENTFGAELYLEGVDFKYNFFP